MRTGRLVPVVVVVALTGACGGGADPESSVDSIVPATTDPVVEEPSASPTTPPSSTTTTSAPPATISPPTTQPSAEDVVVFGAPDSRLVPEALPPSAIDWTAVGPGWLLIDHGFGYGEPTTLDQRGFYLVSPDDAVYGVSALPNDGSWLIDVSDDRGHVLLEQFDPACAEGCYCPSGPPGSIDEPDDRDRQQQVYGFSILDLVTTSVQPAIDPIIRSVCDTDRFLRQVEFTADGSGVWVSETWFTDDYRHEHRARLSRVEIDTGEWTTILDETFEIDETMPPSTAGIGFVELDEDRIAVSTRAGSWVRRADGSPVVELDVPDPNCDLQRVWDDDHLLARCPASASDFPLRPDVLAEHCPASGLWLVPIDGTGSSELAVPLDDDGYVYCWAGYASAEPRGDDLAVGVGGDGCSDGVVLITADGARTAWWPDFADSCTELLIGVRNDAWLLSASSEFAETGVYEVTPDATVGIDLPSGSITVL